MHLLLNNILSSKNIIKEVSFEILNLNKDYINMYKNNNIFIRFIYFYFNKSICSAIIDILNNKISKVKIIDMIKYGKIDYIKFLYKNKLSIDNNIVYFCILYDYDDCLKYIIENDYDNIKLITNYAISNENSNSIRNISINEIFIITIKYDKIKCFEYLVYKNILSISIIIGYCLYYNSIKILKYLKNNNIGLINSFIYFI